MIDVNVPGELLGSPPRSMRGEGQVNAWGPFRVWLEDADSSPVYIGSRLRFFWDPPSKTLMVSFFPAEPPTMKIYTVLEGGRDQPAWTETSDAGSIQFRTLEHGWCEIQPITDQREIDLARRSCRLD